MGEAEPQKQIEAKTEHGRRKVREVQLTTKVFREETFVVGDIFGFKSHIKLDNQTKIITAVAVTTAKTFDGNVDLAKQDEVIYRDRCYTGVGTRAIGKGFYEKRFADSSRTVA